MAIIQHSSELDKSGGYLHFVGEQPTVAVGTIAHVTTAARRRFPNAVLHRFFDDIHGGGSFARLVTRCGTELPSHGGLVTAGAIQIGSRKTWTDLLRSDISSSLVNQLRGADDD